MTDLRQAAQQALEALEYHVEQTRLIWKTSEAIAALEAALADQNRGWYTIDEINAKFDPEWAPRRGDIIRMAREAGLAESPEEYNPYWTADDVETLERFAALVAAAEREACAKVCDKHWDDNGQHCANAIRSRT